MTPPEAALICEEDPQCGGFTYKVTYGTILEMWKMLNVYGSKHYTAIYTQMIRLNANKVDRTFNYTLHSKSFKSLKIT